MQRTHHSFRILLPIAGAAALALSGCGKHGAGQAPDPGQTTLEACRLADHAGRKLLPEIHEAIENTSADPAGTLQRFQTATAAFKTATAQIGNPKVKAATDVVVQDLEKIITGISAVQAAGKAGKSQDDLHIQVREQIQPLANNFMNDWNNQLIGAACSG